MLLEYFIFPDDFYDADVILSADDSDVLMILSILLDDISMPFLLSALFV